MHRILSGFAALIMTAGTVAFATPAEAAPTDRATACEKAVAAGARAT